MPITELGFFRLKPTTPITSPALLANLLTAKLTCEAFTSHHGSNKNATFRWEHCVEDASLIYYVGSWASVDEHRVAFVNSKENKQLQSLLGGQVSVEGYFHLELDQTRVDVGSVFDGDGDGDGDGDEKGKGKGTGKGTEVTVVRHFVKKGCRPEVERLWDRSMGPGLKVGGGAKVVGGWRIDKEAEDKEELVLFVAVDRKGQRLGVGETVLGGKEVVMCFFDRVEVTHAVKLDVGKSAADGKGTLSSD